MRVPVQNDYELIEPIGSRLSQANGGGGRGLSLAGTSSCTGAIVFLAHPKTGPSCDGPEAALLVASWFIHLALSRPRIAPCLTFRFDLKQHVHSSVCNKQARTARLPTSSELLASSHFVFTLSDDRPDMPSPRHRPRFGRTRALTVACKFFLVRV